MFLLIGEVGGNCRVKKAAPSYLIYNGIGSRYFTHRFLGFSCENRYNKYYGA